MPIYIPVYQRRLDPNTGEPVYDQNGTQIMDLVETIVVPDPPVIEVDLQLQAESDAYYTQLLAQQSQSIQETTENP
jgi:hypothetical protein